LTRGGGAGVPGAGAPWALKNRFRAACVLEREKPSARSLHNIETMATRLNYGRALNYTLSETGPRPERFPVGDCAAGSQCGEGGGAALAI